MNELTDQQLLRDYAESRSESAFAELVERHIDFIYSAALRMVRDAQLAEDVTQSVFLALAENARQLAKHPVLPGWLYRTTQNLAANSVRADVRRRAREQEAATMNELLSNEPDATWEQIAPHLDSAIGELNDADRYAVLLRYFQRKSAREIAQVLGLTEDAAQKRVSRAVERLREFFSKRGVTVGASGLVVVISANAVQAAPIGFALTISSALVGTTLASATTATAIKTIAMTTLQKSLIAAIVVAAVGAGIFEARENSTLRTRVQLLEQQKKGASANQLGQLTDERDEMKRQLAELHAENEQLNRNSAELIKLRDEVGRLRTNLANLKLGSETNSDNPMQAAMKSWIERAKTLQLRLKEVPEINIPEFQFLKEVDWLDAVKEFDPDENFEGDLWIRYAAAQLRDTAKGHFAMEMAPALDAYLKANNDELPKELSELNSYFKSPVSDEILNRYKLIQQGKYSDRKGELVTEKKQVGNDNTRIEIGRRGYSHANWKTSETARK